MKTKNCLTCSALLRGRADKKFCNDYCRNNFNNEQKQKNSQYHLVKDINNTLLKNRKVLATLLPDQQDLAKAAKEKMLRLGFHFRYFTHHYTTKTGKIYYYCYDYGYLPLENDWFLIVKKKEE
ncbi:MAG: hypothetical protein NTW29_17635 [Bacteroidetes bacterium]|nr:hypothetical protein [Bacteroidota bacterium]